MNAQYARKHADNYAIEVTTIPHKVPGMDTVKMVDAAYDAWLKRRGLARPTWHKFDCKTRAAK